MRTRLPLVALSTFGVLAVSGCGTETPSSSSVQPRAGGGSVVYAANGMVLESPDHGPQLCLGGVDDSYPPQCSGPDIAGWSWSAVDGDTTANGASWGEYHVVGTYDGSTFTLTEPPTPPVIDPDQPTLNDPTKLVLNVAVTGDTGAAESAIRAVWGGALCVGTAKHSDAELQAIMYQIVPKPGVLGTSTDVTTGTVQIQVVLDDGLQAWADETFGKGIVVVQSALQPAE